MKKLLLTLLFIPLFLLFTPLFLPFNIFNQLNQSNEPNQFFRNQSNKLNSIVCAQETEKKETGPIQIPESYVIGQGDVIEVFVWRNNQLSRQVTVRPDGKISLPLIQDFQAEGLTILQLKDGITRQFKQYVQNPTVTVIIRQINSYKISILGRVAKPGIYSLTTKTTLLEAISMAGGLTEWANKRKITVIRNQGGQKKKLLINYKKIVSGKDLSQNITLQRGDTIVVP